MTIKTLVENTILGEGLEAEHGLSLYIETKEHKILFDAGESSLFLENAAKMGVDLSKVDLVVISHGHRDHGGGLETFLDNNSHAKVYVREGAFGPHYAQRKDGVEEIGLDRELLSRGRFVFAGERLDIDGELTLFSGVVGNRLNPSGNKRLLMEKDGELVEDDFSHEQSLLIREQGSTVLVAGCAHRGIANILEHVREAVGSYPDHVVGGFHLMNNSAGTTENPGVVAQLGGYLQGIKAVCHTCHCTGLEPYGQLKGILGDGIGYLSTGSVLEIN
ncbi:MBL fold metallo-hydrolase [Anaerotalea alkaliphila]|uniref:MBL fold metallo-hydrolase n=1 Tax=Anaerotalea alkaliphila TaxID=2662126 RepID=A0A7X5KP74_9FIRM|nr:MBL fold metallo-hydrolase [Anaerotalea alkaliphila]NDL68804.1 MBL fold metallo-hydrolase [Anaerotalea alkaliphila]